MNDPFVFAGIMFCLSLLMACGMVKMCTMFFNRKKKNIRWIRVPRRTYRAVGFLAIGGKR